MRRRATRVLVWLRWPTALLVVLVLSLISMSYIWNPYASGKLWNLNATFYLDCGSLRATVWMKPEPRRWPVYIDCNLANRYYPIEWFEGWWTFEHNVTFWANARVDIFSFPAWCIFFSLGAFSWAGFRAKRRLAPPAGLCARCRHPLAGAVCPECGAPAPLARPVAD